MDKNIKVIFVFALFLIIPLVNAQPFFQQQDFDVGLTPVIPGYDSIKKDTNFTNIAPFKKR